MLWNRKTKVNAEDGKQELVITREFDLPLELLFKAYAEPGIVEQWMGTKVLKLESKEHGGYRFETTDGQGKVVFRANGVIHEFSPNRKITRTFEMENTPFGVQLEFYEFEKLTTTPANSRCTSSMNRLHKETRCCRLPFAQGINMAHNRLQEIVKQIKIISYGNEK